MIPVPGCGVPPLVPIAVPSPVPAVSVSFCSPPLLVLLVPSLSPSGPSSPSPSPGVSPLGTPAEMTQKHVEEFKPGDQREVEQLPPNTTGFCCQPPRKSF